MIHVYIPIKTTNPNNGQTGNSRIAGIMKAKRRKEQRSTVRLVVENKCRAFPLGLPVQVVVRRVAPSAGLDPHDGLGAALKSCVDAIADALGFTNDRDPRLTWVLEQRRGKPKEYGIEVEIMWR